MSPWDALAPLAGPCVILLALGVMVWAGIWIDLLLGGPDDEIG